MPSFFLISPAFTPISPVLRPPGNPCTPVKSPSSSPLLAWTPTPTRHVHTLSPRESSSHRTPVKNTTELPSLPPGTTSLLLRISDGDAASTEAWARDAFREIVFGAQGSLPVPVSLLWPDDVPHLLFHATDGVRGALSLKVESTAGPAVLLRVTSASRFAGPPGRTRPGSLPGERAILRALHAAAAEKFGVALSIAHRPHGLRLRGAAARGPVADVAVAVAELSGATNMKDLVDWLRAWPARRQFGALRWGPRAVPLRAKPSPGGVQITVPRDGGEDLVTAAARERRSGGKIKKVLVVVSATAPDERGNRNVIERYVSCPRRLGAIWDRRRTTNRSALR